MKKIVVKRLVYNDGNGKSHIGGHEYDGRLTDDNILCAIHEVGKTAWIGQSLWTIRMGVPQYRISVEKFYQYQKRWYDLVIDAVRRI